MWLELMRLAKNPPAAWTLIGAHMVVVHGWAFARQPIRTSLDADVLVDVRLVAGGTAEMSQALVRDGFELVDYSRTGVGHTFAAGDVRFDVLAPDNLGRRARLKTVPGFRTIMVPGGTQALARSAPIEIRSRSVVGLVPLPSLLGAILIKTRAIAVDDLPANQRSDVAFLFSLIEDPDEFVSQITPTERGWLRRHPYFGDSRNICWSGIVGTEAGANVYRRLADT
jgi:hypothetical protein